MGSTPHRIFKYVSPDRIDIIEKLRIRFTPPSCFNDPFEARFCIDGLDDDKVMCPYVEMADRRHYRAHVLVRPAGTKLLSFEEFQKHEAPRNRAALEQLKRNPRAKERATARAQEYWDIVGILSLSAAENNVLMWAHYTNSHEGMVIEFNTAHQFFSPSTKPEIDLGTLVGVNYSDKRPRHVIGETVPPAHFTVKSREWAYEQEWRVFQPLENSDYKESAGGQTIHLFKLPPKAITRIVCGCRMSDDNRKRVCEAVSRNPQLHGVTVLHATPDIETFRLVYSRETPLRPATINPLRL